VIFSPVTFVSSDNSGEASTIREHDENTRPAACSKLFATA
jgi:hypothetical protein